MKKALLILLLLCSFAINAYSQDNNSKHADNTEPWKWGIQGSNLMPRFGPFAEYKLNKIWGLRAALLGYIDVCITTKDASIFEGFAIPITFRFYPYENRQTAIPLGIQVSYLAQHDDQSPLERRLALYMVSGADYEFPGGFQIGLGGSIRLTKLYKDEDVENPLYYCGARLELGYNLAKLFVE